MGDLGWEPVRDLVKADRRGALVTIVAGPLNSAGANPKIECELPEPSR